MNGDTPKAKFHAAQRLFRENQYSESLAILDELDASFPNDANIVYARARCLVELGRPDEARPICVFLDGVLGDSRGAALLQKLAPAPAVERSSKASVRAGGAIPFAKIGVLSLAGLALLTVAAVPFIYARETGPVEHPTYARDIAPILNENCVVCHRPGEAVPMTMLTYDQVRPWAKSIGKMVETRQMPPWHADASVGTWKNDRRLREADITTIVRWAEQGAPQGNPEDAPDPVEFIEGWKMGEPDMILTMLAEEVLPPQLEDEYRYVYIPTGFTDDRWIEAAEVRPGNYEVVHHVIVFTAKLSDLMSGKGLGGEGLGGSLGGYAPGGQPLIMEDGRGLKVGSESALVLQMHYHKEPGTQERDRTSVGLRFAKKPVEKELRFGAVGTERFAIPAGAADHSVVATQTIRDDIHLEQLIPHMHLRGKDMRVWAKLPNGEEQDLILIPRYDFNWQTFYELERPVALPKGTVLSALAHYDNSSGNPFNPNPNAVVRWGLPTTAEMMYAFFAYTVDDEELDVVDPGGTGSS